MSIYTNIACWLYSQYSKIDRYISGKDSSMTIVEMRVHMDCPGCENKIKKALQKLNGVDDIDIDMQMQKVTVTGWADRKRVLKKVRKTGRKAEFWPFPYNPEYHDFTRYYYQQNHHQQYSHSYIPEATSSYYYSQPQPSSSYNYRVHGYNGHDHGYFQQPPYSTILDEKASSLFSDDNINACTIV